MGGTQQCFRPNGGLAGTSDGGKGGTGGDLFGGKGGDGGRGTGCNAASPNGPVPKRGGGGGSGGGADGFFNFTTFELVLPGLPGTPGRGAGGRVVGGLPDPRDPINGGAGGGGGIILAAAGIRLVAGGLLFGDGDAALFGVCTIAGQPCAAGPAFPDGLPGLNPFVDWLSLSPDAFFISGGAGGGGSGAQGQLLVTPEPSSFLLVMGCLPWVLWRVVRTRQRRARRNA
jgi:hypothetical protein